MQCASCWTVNDATETLKPRPHQQQCWSNVRLCCKKTATMSNEFIVKFRPFDKVECCLEIVVLAHMDHSIQRSRWNVAWFSTPCLCIHSFMRNLALIEERCEYMNIETWKFSKIAVFRRFWGYFVPHGRQYIPIRLRFGLLQYTMDLVSCRIWSWSGKGGWYSSPKLVWW